MSENMKERTSLSDAERKKVTELTTKHLVSTIYEHNTDYEAIAQRLTRKAELIQLGNIYSDDMDPYRKEVAAGLRVIAAEYLKRAR